MIPRNYPAPDRPVYGYHRRTKYFEYGRWRHVVIRRHQGTVNLRYLAPPFALLGTVFSLFLGCLLSPLWFIPAAIYLVFLMLASLSIGRNFREYLQLPWILLTMHMSWGAGYLTSSRSLVPEE